MSDWEELNNIHQNMDGMKITLCGSIEFAERMDGARKQLESEGHTVLMPATAERILKGEFSAEQITREKETGEISKRTKKYDAIRVHHEKIKESDAVLILNYDKKGIKNYIGGNSLLEIGFAYVLDKKIFILNELPDLSYSDEIRAMSPKILSGDISKI